MKMHWPIIEESPGNIRAPLGNRYSGSTGRTVFK